MKIILGKKPAKSSEPYEFFQSISENFGMWLNDTHYASKYDSINLVPIPAVISLDDLEFVVVNDRNEPQLAFSWDDAWVYLT